ncbi:MAG TPA: PaeR7I family type II restriction endonuclease [bacterium]|nr:PaeR7I family type II restriction endonuclease [bacterium]
MDIERYRSLIDKAVRVFWETRSKQRHDQNGREIRDAGNRSAVTGGKQLNGFLELLSKIAIDTGVPESCIHLKGNSIPGYFRPTKDWDMLIITPDKKLIAMIELKSQVGSFGNNFNNRTEEALGSAVDLWTAFRENAFPNQSAPWLGYFMLIEKSCKSETPVRINKPHFNVFSEFQGTSYIDRYKILCQKLILERHYSHCGLMWSSQDCSYGNVDSAISIETFINSFAGHLSGHISEFN